jgi:iron complex transport system substrate-binding protein
MFQNLARNNFSKTKQTAHHLIKQVSKQSRTLFVALLTLALLSFNLLTGNFFFTGLSVANAATASKQSTASYPTKIISLSPTATEDLYAIGAGEQVIAVDNDSDYPNNLPANKLDGFNPNAESIAARHPDLVVIQSSATGEAGVVAALTKLKIKTYVEVTPNDLNGAYQELIDLGNLTGHQVGATAAVSFMKQRIANILLSVKLKSPLTFYHELDNTGYSITSKTFIGQVYKAFGLVNIADAADNADSGGYPQLQSEYVVKANPDLIFLADGDGPDGHESYSTLKKRPGFNTITAIKKNQVTVLPLDIPSRWSVRLVNFYGLVAKKLQAISNS